MLFDRVMALGALFASCSDANGSMNGNTTGGRAIRIASMGHAAFAATLIALGILGLVKRGFAPVWLPVPESVPARAVLIYLCALIPLASACYLPISCFGCCC